jgi:hypothetical protein
MLRAIRGETKSQRRDHLQVFREFLGQLDRIGRRPSAARSTSPKGTKARSSRSGSRGR